MNLQPGFPQEVHPGIAPIMETVVLPGCALELTPGQALALVEAKDDVLRQTGRIDLEQDTIPKLINAFHDSLWFPADDPVEVLSGLTELFYTHRGLIPWSVTDDELIAHMRKEFDLCRGELELMSGRNLEDVRRESLGLERQGET